MLELATKVLEVSGSASKIVFQPLPRDDPRQRRPDISRAQARLDWKPAVGLDEGLRETVRYFRSSLDA